MVDSFFKMAASCVLGKVRPMTSGRRGGGRLADGMLCVSSATFITVKLFYTFNG